MRDKRGWFIFLITKTNYTKLATISGMALNMITPYTNIWNTVDRDFNESC